MEALNNLKEIRLYISKDSEYYANRLIRQLYSSVKILHSHPECGKVVVTIKEKELRRIVFKSYRIIYTYYKFEIYIIAVFHQSRNNSDSLPLTNLFE